MYEIKDVVCVYSIDFHALYIIFSNIYQDHPRGGYYNMVAFYNRPPPDILKATGYYSDW